MRPFVTVYSGGEGVDLSRAPRAVLEALPGMTPALIEQLQSAGPDFDLFEAIEDESLLERARALLPADRATWCSRCGRSRAHRGRRHLRARGGDRARRAAEERPYLVHAWRRGALPTGLAG